MIRKDTFKRIPTISSIQSFINVLSFQYFVCDGIIIATFFQWGRGQKGFGKAIAPSIHGWFFKHVDVIDHETFDVVIKYQI